MYGPQQTVEGGFEAMYAQTVDHAMRGVGNETFEAVDQLKKYSDIIGSPASWGPAVAAQKQSNGRFLAATDDAPDAADAASARR